MSRQSLPSWEESVEFFDKTAGAIMLLGDDLVQSTDPRTAEVGRVLFSLLCHGLNLAFGREKTLADLNRLVDQVNQLQMQKRTFIH